MFSVSFVHQNKLHRNKIHYHHREADFKLAFFSIRFLTDYGPVVFQVGAELIPSLTYSIYILQLQIVLVAHKLLGLSINYLIDEGWPLMHEQTYIL